MNPLPHAMNANPHAVTVSKYDCNSCSVPTVQVTHQRFPELRIADRSTRLAAIRLANRLTAHLEAVSPPSLREPVLQAIEDVREFLEQEPDSAQPKATPR